MNEPDSIAFDRAAGYYDRTRALPEEVRAQVTDLLIGELSGRGPCFEPGVGTGRIALPLHDRGVPIVGADLSVPMLHRLVDNAGGRQPFPLLRADLTALPVPDASLGAAYVCHVLHLIPRWRDAASELVRVVRPGGVILVDLGNSASGAGREVNREFARQSGQRRPRPGVTDAQDLDLAMAELGAPLRVAHTIPITVRYTVEEILARIESNQFSSTWGLDDATRTRAAVATRAWARERFGDLDAPRSEASAVLWRAYDVSTRNNG